MRQQEFGRRPAAIVDPASPQIRDTANKKPGRGAIPRPRGDVLAIVTAAALTFALAIFIAFDGATAAANGVGKIVAAAL